MCLLVENYPVFATDNDKRLEERKILGLRKFKKKKITISFMVKTLNYSLVLFLEF